MTGMADKLAGVLPELATLIGACVCMLLGTSGRAGVRRALPWVVGVSLVVAWLLVGWPAPAGVGQVAGAGGAGGVPVSVVAFAKAALCGVGLLLLALVPGAGAGPRVGAGGNGSVPGEYYAFFLFSLTGAMLCAGARDLVWLFLALELTSVPTYVMVAVSRGGHGPKEAAVKYFFLGAMAAAVFLYGFTLIYGATGSTSYDQIGACVARDGLSPLLVAGLSLAVVGVAFKIAAVPMHFYAADVYQGASSPMTAFLAFVPKAAGFVSIIGLLSVLGGAEAWQYRAVTALIWLMAALTMTVGNTLALVQSNVKRVLAYSSVAHSGYMLVALVPVFGVAPQPVAADPEAYRRMLEVVGPMGAGAAPHVGAAVGVGGVPLVVNGGAWAVLVYLVAYGLATVGVFAVLSALDRRGEEAQTFDDLAGLGRWNPVLGAVMLVSVLSLIGLPPLVGFVGKVCLFSSAIERGHTWLVVVAVLNSAASAVYYLRIASACYFEAPSERVTAGGWPNRWVSGAVAGVGVLVVGLGASRLIDAARGGREGEEPADTAAVTAAVAPAGTGSLRRSLARGEPGPSRGHHYGSTTGH